MSHQKENIQLILNLTKNQRENLFNFLKEEKNKNKSEEKKFDPKNISIEMIKKDVRFEENQNGSGNYDEYAPLYIKRLEIIRK